MRNTRFNLRPRDLNKKPNYLETSEPQDKVIQRTRKRPKNPSTSINKKPKLVATSQTHSINCDDDSSDYLSENWEDVEERNISDIVVRIESDRVKETKIKFKRKLRGLISRLVKLIRIDIHKTCLLSIIALGRMIVRNPEMTKQWPKASCCNKHIGSLNLTNKKDRLIVAYVAPSLSGNFLCCYCNNNKSKKKKEEKCDVCLNKRPFFKETVGSIYAWTEKRRNDEWITKNPHSVRGCCRKDINYIFAFDQSLEVCDVTKSYMPHRWHPLMRDNERIERVDSDFYKNLLTQNDNEECLSEQNRKFIVTLGADYTFDNFFRSHLVGGKSMTVPIKMRSKTRISDFKNHPTYVLKRHLLKFETIFPLDTAPLGEFRNESVYARSSVVHLHSPLTWLKNGREIIDGEEPLKKVKSRKSWKNNKDDDLGLFGEWQTCLYKPPICKNAIVPLNQYGNVDLFKPQMLPLNCVHLKESVAIKACKNLNVNFAAACVDFDTHKGHVHPVFDGIVIPEECLSQVNQEIARLELMNRDKLKKELKDKAFRNWKLFIKSLILKEKYESFH